MTEGYIIRYRDLDGREADSPPMPTLAEAVRQAHMLERYFKSGSGMALAQKRFAALAGAPKPH